PGGDALGHGITQVRLHLGQRVPHLAGAAAERDQQPVQVVLDEVAGCVRGSAAHAMPPAVASTGDAEPSSTRAIEPLNSRPRPPAACRAGPPPPAAGGWRSRPPRPAPTSQPLASRPAPSSRCSAGYTVPSGSWNAPSLRTLSRVMTS